MGFGEGGGYRVEKRERVGGGGQGNKRERGGERDKKEEHGEQEKKRDSQRERVVCTGTWPL